MIICAYACVFTLRSDFFLPLKLQYLLILWFAASNQMAVWFFLSNCSIPNLFPFHSLIKNIINYGCIVQISIRNTTKAAKNIFHTKNEVFYSFHLSLIHYTIIESQKSKKFVVWSLPLPSQYRHGHRHSHRSIQ